MALTANKQTAEIVILGTDKTKRAFATAGKGLDTIQGKFSGMRLAAAGAVGIVTALTAGVVLLTKRAIENADAIAKTADKVGLAVESLQELRFGAEYRSCSNYGAYFVRTGVEAMNYQHYTGGTEDTALMGFSISAGLQR